MPDRKSWEASIGRVYRTRGGKRVQVDSVGESEIWVRIVEFPSFDIEVNLDFEGRNYAFPEYDLIDLDRTTNMDGAK